MASGTTELPLNTKFATLDVTNTQRRLASSFTQTPSLNNLLVDIYHDGSSASAQSASHFLQDKIRTVSDAHRVANIVKSFAGAIPKHNVAPFANLAAFLAISFSSPSTSCSAPLETFCFTDPDSKRQAVAEIVSCLSWSDRIQLNRTVTFDIAEALYRIFPFFKHILSDSDQSIRRDAVHALFSLPSSTVPPSLIAAFLNKLPASHSPFSSSLADDETGDTQPDHSFEAFLTLSIARGIAPTSNLKQLSTSVFLPPTFSELLSRTLLRSIDLGTTTALFDLHSFSPSQFNSAVSHVSPDIVIFILTILAANLAHSGKILECTHALLILNSITLDHKKTKMHPIVLKTSRVVATSIVTLASAASARELSQLASTLFQQLNGSIDNSQYGKNHPPDPAYTQTDHFQQRCDEMADCAICLDCPAALSLVLMLRALGGKWRLQSTSFLFANWLEKDMLHMMAGTSVFYSADHETAVSNSKDPTKEQDIHSFQREEEYYNSNLGYEEQAIGLDDIEYKSPVTDNSILSVCAAVICLVCLLYPKADVRSAAATVLAQFPDASVMLFFLPATMVQLSVETNPAVAIQIVQSVIPSECLLKSRETSGIALTSIVRIMKNVTSKLLPPNTSTASTIKDTLTLAESFSVTPEDIATVGATLQTGLVSIAMSAKHSPGRATKILVVEIEKLRSRFDKISASERIAGASAILALVKQRPARGSKFVPYITLCIQKENAEISPEAASMCIDSMLIMCEEEVMDPTKTVKIVMKKLPSVESMSPLILESFLKLIRCASMDTESKKGKALSETVISLLRKCITDYSAKNEKDNNDSDFGLDWSLVSIAADSLAMFSANDILRIMYSNEESLLDLEEERKRLEKIEESCGLFVGSILETVNNAPEIRTRDSLQILLTKIAKFEWDQRPRGNFDPERIAKLRATSKALERSRKRNVVVKSSTQRQPSHGKSGRADHLNEEEDLESISEQFAHAVEGMPTGVIKTLCSSSSNLNPFSMRACAEAGAVTNALPWIQLVEERLSNSQHDLKVKDKEILQNDISEDEILASCYCVLRLAQTVDKDKSELQRVRKKWFVSDGFKDCRIKKSLDVFLGIFSFDEIWRSSQSLQDVQDFQTIQALIVKGITSLRNRPESKSEDEKIMTIVRSILDVLEEKEKKKKNEGPFWNSNQSDVTEEALCIHAKNEILELIWAGARTAVLVRLVCRLGESSAVRTVALDITNGRHDDLESNVAILGHIGCAISKLRAEVRRGIICEFAEKPSKARAFIICYALGASVWLPQLGKSLLASLTLCDLNERVAVRKLADYCNEVLLRNDH